MMPIDVLDTRYFSWRKWEFCIFSELQRIVGMFDRQDAKKSRTRRKLEEQIDRVAFQDDKFDEIQDLCECLSTGC